MSVSAKVVRFTTGTGAAGTTRTVAVPFAPKAIICQMVRKTSDGAVTGRQTMSIGFASGSADANQYGCVYDSLDSDNIVVSYANSGCCVVEESDGNGRLKVQSFPGGAGDITFEVVAQFGLDSVVNVLVLGGDDNYTVRSALIGGFSNLSVSDLGYDPTAVFVCSHFTDTLNSNSEGMGFGMFTGSAQAAIGSRGQHLASPNNAGIITTSRCLARPDPTGGSGLVDGYSGSLQTGGFLLTLNEGGGNFQVGYLATSAASVNLGTAAAQTGTGEWDARTGLGFTPAAALLVSRPGVTASEGTTGSNDINWTIGMLSEDGGAAQQGTAFGSDEDGLGTRDTHGRVESDAVLVAHDYAAGAWSERFDVAAAADPLQAGKVRLNQVVASPAADLIAIMAIGPAASGGGNRVVPRVGGGRVGIRVAGSGLRG